MKITKESAISAGLLLVSLINQVLTMFGHSPLPLENDAVKNVVSTVLTASFQAAAANDRTASGPDLSETRANKCPALIALSFRYFH